MTVDQADQVDQHEDPLSQMDGEPHHWYARFRRFALMGPGRKLLSLYNSERDAKGRKRGRKVPSSWQDVVVRWKWKERASAYDDYIDRQEAEKQERLRDEYRKREFTLANALIEKAEQMLAFPLATTETEHVSEGGTVINRTVVMPAKWSMRDAASMAQTADALMRLSLGMETDRPKHTVTFEVGLEEIRKKRWASVAEQIAELSRGYVEDDSANDNDTNDTKSK